ncbi:MAG TPA: hypothetical protein VMU24_02090, partial [Candidatus Acidoferrales bacterium]|nr:hypothetical protein [Candidatus Acidoferrales bacterium]
GPSFVVNVSGSQAAATVWAGATNSTTMVPIDITKNTAGTAITLPAKPNSFIMSNQGSYALLGADSNGAMVMTGTGTVKSLPYNGRAVAVSPDGTSGVLVNKTDGYVYFVSLTGSSITGSIPISNDITSAAYTPDSNTVWMTDGTGTLITYNNTKGLLKYSLTAPSTSAAFLANGPVAYLNSGKNIEARATCDPTQIVDTQTFTAPGMLQALPNASGVVALDLPNLDIINSVVPTQVINSTANGTYTCATSVTETTSQYPLPNSSITVNQFYVTPDSSKAVITTSNNAMYIVNLSNGKVTTVSPGAGATSLFQGGALSDSSMFYVGGSDGTVHKIDLSAGADAQQISVGLKDTNGNNTSPNLVQVAFQ